MSEAAEKAWATHEQAIYRSSAAFGPQYPFVVGYDAGVADLTAQLREVVSVANANAAEGLQYKAERDAAQATIAEALSYFGDGETAYIAKVLRRADTTPHAPVEKSPRYLFYTTLRGMNPSKELSAAIDRAEARDDPR